MFTLLAVAVGWSVPAYGTDNIVPNPTYHVQCTQGNGTPTGTLCLTDNSDVYYYMDSSGEYELETTDREEVRGVYSRDFSPTHLVIHYDSSPVFSGGGETDTVFQEGSAGMPANVIGMTWCDDPVDGTTYRCDQHYIRIRGNGWYSDAIACHEMAHSVGLTHGAQAGPVVANDSSILGCVATPPGTRLGSNQTGNINLVYP